MGVLNIYVIKSRRDLGNQLFPFWVCVFEILFKNSLFNSRSLKCFAVFFSLSLKPCFCLSPKLAVPSFIPWMLGYNVAIDVREQT